MTETAAQRNYKKTLNLPSTSFPMRANLAQNEPASEKRWEAMRLYDRVLDARRDGEPYVFHDGPPFANAGLHTGHLLNKVLKDVVVRSRLLGGRHCAFVPGWDCHGLPIEHKVVTELLAAGKLEALRGEDESVQRMAIRRACHRSAEKAQKLQAKQMKRLLTLADYAHPYLTMEPRYERAVLDVFAALVEQGLVYRAMRPVHWSIENETALAEAELEYEEREDLSVYVDFEAVDRGAVAAAFGVDLDTTPSFMIWTTTPWTLPANLAIAVHERFRYALVRLDGNVTVIASDLVNRVAATGADDVEVLAEADGAALVGLAYRHPFCDRVSPILAAEYVTLEDGTGLVHTAPGHGAEDFATGVAAGLETYCPVRDDGTFDDTVPEWLRGLSVWDANPIVTEHLRESGHLYHDETFVHSYPHDWRSKTPVIFRSTEQWFVSVDRPTKRERRSLRELALTEADSAITFYPEWGRNRFRGMIESRPDWCLSRQRAWGLPIPAFRQADGTVFLTAATVRAVADVIGGERGSDAWFTATPAELLADYDPADDPLAPDDLDVASLTKMHDIFDVWLESGSSWNAAMRQRDLGFPVDLYLEGSDQHRGWFQLSLLPALGMFGTTPFRRVLTHGFVVDKDGRKMSKSGDNALDVDEVVQKYGADVCRWWVSSLAFENDVKADVSFFEVAGESYRKVRNTLRFLLSNLHDFTPPAADGTGGDAVDVGTLAPAGLDAYLLAEATKLQDAVLAAYEHFEFRRLHQAIYDFCNETLSAFYCAAVKDRLYCDRPDSPRRRATQTVMWRLADMLIRLLAPVLPHTADEAYRALPGADAADERSVHLETFAEMPDVTVDEAWPQAVAARDAALKAIEEAKTRGIDNPLDAEVVLPDAGGVLARFAADFADMLGVSRVQFAPDGEIVVNDLSAEPRCERSWKRDGTVRRRRDGGMLSDRDAEAVGVA